MGYVPVVSLKTNRKEKWEYDEKYIKVYKRINVVEIFFKNKKV